MVIVIKFVYPKYGCRKCKQGRCRIIQAPAKPCLITNGLPADKTVAHAVAGKFAGHLPLERQTRMFRRQGTGLDAGTLGGWVKRAAFAPGPVHEQLLASLKASGIGSADETTIPVHPGRRDAAAGQGPPLIHRGKTRQQYFWGFHRDERPWQGVNPPGTAFIHAPGAAGNTPGSFCQALRASCMSMAMPLQKAAGKPGDADQARALHGACAPQAVRDRANRP